MKKIVKRTIQVIVITIISLLLLIQAVQKIYPNSNGFLGYKTFVIVSASMEPKLKVGDVILVRYIKPQDVKINDIITYKGESENYRNKIITHQVKNIMQENKRYIYYTKGISNSSLDPAVYEEQLYGIMKYRFMSLSIVSRILRSTIGFILLIVLPLSFLLVGEIRQIKKEINERR